jgi:WD40 repeat protein
VRADRLFILVLVLLTSVPGAPAQELKERATFKGHRFRIDRAVLSPDGKILAAGGGDTRGVELKLWDAASGEEIASLPGCTDSLCHWLSARTVSIWRLKGWDRCWSGT